MQNHLEISSTNQFWIRNVRNWTKSRDLVMSRPVQEQYWKMLQTKIEAIWFRESNFTRFGSKNGILTKFIDDSASFLLEKLKNHIILTKNLNILPKIQKIPQQF